MNFQLGHTVCECDLDQLLLKLEDSSAQNLSSSNMQIWWVSFKCPLELELICLRQRLWACLSSHSHSACKFSFSPLSHYFDLIFFACVLAEIVWFFLSPKLENMFSIWVWVCWSQIHFLFYLFAQKSQLFTYDPHLPFSKCPFRFITVRLLDS